MQVSSIKSQLGAIRNGLTELIPLQRCQLLAAHEFELLLCGVPSVSFVASKVLHLQLDLRSTD